MNQSKLKYCQYPLNKILKNNKNHTHIKNFLNSKTATELGAQAR